MLSKLSTDDLKRYGLNLCDLFDLFDLVRDSSILTSNQYTQESTAEGANCINPASSTNGPTGKMTDNEGDPFSLDDVDMDKSQDSEKETPSPQGDKSITLINSPGVVGLVDYDSEGSNISGGSDTSLNSNDKVFVGFANPSTVHKLKSYDRYCFKKQILKYHKLSAKGLVLEKPKPFIDQKKKACSSDDLSSRQRSSRKTSCSGEANSSSSSSRNSSGPGEASSSRRSFSEPRSSDEVRSSGRSSRVNYSSDDEHEAQSKTQTKRNRDAGGSPKSKRTKKSHSSSSKKGHKLDERKQTPRADLLKEHKAFLSDENLSPKDKKEIRRFLEDNLNPKYEIIGMLSTMAEEDESVASLQTKLEKDGVVFEGDLSKLVAVLMENLYAQTSNPNMVTAHMREGLAVCLVATFPRLAHESITSEEKPWSWIYDRKNNKGRLANYHAHKQKTSGATRLRGGGSKPKQEKKKAQVEEIVFFSTVDDLGLSKDTRYLRLIMPDDRHKSEIEDLMDKSYQERRALVANPKCPVRLLLAAYPHLKSFGGIMIDQEFERMFKGKGSLLIRNFSDLVPKLLNIAKESPEKYPAETCTKFDDSSLNALMVLSLLLPKPKRVVANVWESAMDTRPLLKDFFDIVPTGMDLRTFILERREHDGTPVQPFLVGTGTHKKIESIALVLGDSEFINLPRSTMPLRAVDLLIKTNYVLSTHFYLGWKYVFRFLIANVYKMKLENPRHSAFTEQFKTIMG